MRSGDAVYERFKRTEGSSGDKGRCRKCRNRNRFYGQQKQKERFRTFFYQAVKKQSAQKNGGKRSGRKIEKAPYNKLNDDNRNEGGKACADRPHGI